MNGWINALIGRYARQGVIIDTNLLLLLFAGLAGPSFIPKFKRTEKYAQADFELLLALIQPFARIVVTPQILAEVTNLSPDHQAFFQNLLAVLREAREEYVPKDLMLDSTLLPKIGFADLSLLEAAKAGKYLVITDDLRAYGYLSSAECDVINLNHLRGESWGLGNTR